MRVSFWDDKRPVLVQMRFPEDHTPAGQLHGLRSIQAWVPPEPGKLATIFCGRFLRVRARMKGPVSSTNWI